MDAFSFSAPIVMESFKVRHHKFTIPLCSIKCKTNREKKVVWGSGQKNILLPLFVLTLSFINASPVIDICGEWMASKQIVASMLVLPRKNANLQRSTTAISRPSQSSARPLQGTIAVNMSREFQRKNVKNRGIKMVKDRQPKGLMRTSHLFPFRLFNMYISILNSL